MAIDAAHVELATKIDALEGKLIYGPGTYYSEHITTLSPGDAARPATVRPFDRLRVPLG